ncbi:MAG TPA: radical SAM protein [Bacteroidales bacterium]|nr:radical SAM protein [Bacteroidales bacterium]
MFQKKEKYLCNAAEYSLLFQPSGEILACHYNRGYILGNYPQNTIDDVWNGEKRKNLTKKIRKGNFPKTCEFCKRAIKNGFYNKSGINKYQYITPGQSGYPSSMEFQLDNICNLECIMCSGEYSALIRKNREKGTPYISPYDENFVYQIKKYIHYLKQASFTGGEPFLIEIYYQIWDLIQILNPHLQIYVSTNGTILNDKIKKYLDKLNFNFTISIDSLQKDNYEKIRRNASLEKTLENIDFFIRYAKTKNLNINIKSVVTPFNYKNIPEVLEFCNNNQINFIPKTVLIPSFGNFSFSSELIIDDATKTFEEIIKIKNPTSQTENNNYSRFKEILNEIKEIKKLRKETIEKYQNQSIKKLEKEFLKKMISQKRLISNYSKTDLKEMAQKLINSINDDESLKKSLISFLSVPSEIIASEFNRKDFNKLIERFRQCSIYEET